MEIVAVKLNRNRTNNYAELVPSRTLCNTYTKFMTDLGSPQLDDAEDTESPPIAGSYSTDQGN